MAEADLPAQERAAGVGLSEQAPDRAGHRHRAPPLLRPGPHHLRLHQVGDRALDSLTIEFNGLLSETGLESDTLVGVRGSPAPPRAPLADPVPAGHRSRSHSAGADARAGSAPAHVQAADAIHRSDRPARGSRPVPVERTRPQHPRPRPPHRAQAGRALGRTAGGGWVGKRRSAWRSFDGLVELHQAHWTAEAGEQGAFADPRIIAFLPPS